jgi:hypothetical protein
MVLTHFILQFQPSEISEWLETVCEWDTSFRLNSSVYTPYRVKNFCKKPSMSALMGMKKYCSLSEAQIDEILSSMSSLYQLEAKKSFDVAVLVFECYMLFSKEDEAKKVLSTEIGRIPYSMTTFQQRTYFCAYSVNLLLSTRGNDVDFLHWALGNLQLLIIFFWERICHYFYPKQDFKPKNFTFEELEQLATKIEEYSRLTGPFKTAGPSLVDVYRQIQEAEMELRKLVKPKAVLAPKYDAFVATIKKQKQKHDFLLQKTAICFCYVFGEARRMNSFQRNLHLLAKLVIQEFNIEGITAYQEIHKTLPNITDQHQFVTFI